MGADQDIKRLDARLSRMEAAQGSSFRSLSAAALPNGVHVTGIETIEVRLDRVITVAPAADGFSVMLAVEGQETPLPPEGARSLSVALIAAAQLVDGGRHGASTDVASLEAQISMLKAAPRREDS